MYWILLVLLIICIIILVPLVLDYLFQKTIRAKRKEDILKIAQVRSRKLGKSIIYFGKDGNVVITGDKNESFDSELSVIDSMKDDSAIIIVNEVLEYYDNPTNVITHLNRVSGDNLYILGYEKNSMRVYWDYKIKSIFEQPYYLPDQTIQWSAPNKIQSNVQQMYKYIFKVMPYNWFN